MSGSAYRDRLFRPGDVRRILRRAAELQDALPSEGSPGGRPQTLEELTRTAEDAGISSVALERALEGDGERPATSKGQSGWSWSWTGAPGRLAIERSVPAAVSSPQTHAKLVKAMRKATGELGNPQAFGDALSWSTSPRHPRGGRDVHAIVEPSEHGRTLVRIEENLAPLRSALFGGLLGGLGGGGLSLVVSLVAAFSPFLIPYLIPIWGLLVYLLAIRLYARRFRAREAQLTAVADAFVAELTAGARIDAANVRVAAEGESHPSRDESQEAAIDSARRASALEAPR